MENTKLRPKRGVADRYGVTTRTIDRWNHHEWLGFPIPIVINGRNYFREDELDDFDRQCAVRAVSGKRSRAA